MGTEMSMTLSYHSTVSTWSTRSTCFFRAAASLAGISSRMRKEKAPLWKSFSSSFCPATVSMSSGR